MPFFLEGEDGLYEFVYRRLRDNGHMVLVVAEGSGQELIAESLGPLDKLSDASGNRLLLDVGLWLCQKLKVSFILYLHYRQACRFASDFENGSFYSYLHC